MPFHVVVFTRPQVAAGALGFQDQLTHALMQRLVELGQQIADIRTTGRVAKLSASSKVVEIYALSPIDIEELQRGRDHFGKDAFMILFLNDAAREACQIHGIQLSYVKEIPDGELPSDVAVFMSMEHYGDIVP